MQLASSARRLSRAFIPRKILFHSVPSLNQHVSIVESTHSSPRQWKNRSSFSHPLWFSGTIHIPWQPTDAESLKFIRHPLAYMAVTCKSLCTIALEELPTEAMKEWHDKFLLNINRGAPSPKIWMVSLYESCSNRKDIELLFDVLEKLRILRMSKFRINANYHEFYSYNVTKVCVDLVAFDFAFKSLQFRNIYGLTPSSVAANYFLRYAEHHCDFELMEKIIVALRKDGPQMTTCTANIVFRRLYMTDNWSAFIKYYWIFTKAKVKLCSHVFGYWLRLALKRGDIESLWKVDRLRKKYLGVHSLVTGLTCVKVLLLERKPKKAAAIINSLVENDERTLKVKLEVEGLLNRWVVHFLRFKNEDDRKALYVGFEDDIPSMLSSLSDTDFAKNLCLDNMYKYFRRCQKLPTPGGIAYLYMKGSSC